MLRPIIVAIVLAGCSGAAYADTNPTPIPIPLIGTQGVAAPYPSTITVVARGGPNQRSAVLVILHNVTHPCPEELAVLLVHNGIERYLLMANAGGCRPLQGTTLVFNASEFAMVDNPPGTSPFSELESVDASVYGTPPVFPAPAPAGPYPVSLPAATTNVNGTWSLYVLDTVAGNRGVIDGGWTLRYESRPLFDADQTNVAVPALGVGPGAAAVYPITFDLSEIQEDVLARDVQLLVTLRHTQPDDLRMVLESPHGRAVVVMANAGGSTDIATGTTLTFGDAYSAPVPNSMPIVGGPYQPGGAYGANIALGGPAPQPPYLTAFGAFEQQSARGIWQLWVYDDALANNGAIESARLRVNLDGPLNVSFAPPATADQPFLPIEGVGEDPSHPVRVTWRNTVDGAYYASGTFTLTPGSAQVSAAVPLKHGSNSIDYFAFSQTGGGTFVYAPNVVTVDAFTYSFAEGATGGFFDLDLTMANPTGSSAPVDVDFLVESGSVVHVTNAVGANRPLQLHGDDYVPGAAMSTIVRSTNGVPLAVERTMSWDARGYGGHGGTSVAPSTVWLFAEGSQGYFHTYVLLANDNATAADVTVDFLLEGGGVVSESVSVPAKSRYTLYAGANPSLVDRSFGINVFASQAIIAERAMYLPGPHLFEGGHGSAGVNATSTHWFLAEGATGNFFDCFVLLSNPTGVAANVTLTYLLPSGATIVQPLVIPARSRSTVNVETVDPQLTNTPVSTTIVSDVGIVAERAMYWPDVSQGWLEAHNSFGVTETALRWGVADGRIGGPRAHQTYILLANPNPYPAEIEVTFLKEALTVSRAYTVAPTSRVNIWANGDIPELGDGVFSADIRVLNAQPIAVEKALYWNADGVTWAAGTNVTATRLPPP